MVASVKSPFRTFLMPNRKRRALDRAARRVAAAIHCGAAQKTVRSRNTQDHDIKSAVFLLFVFFTEKPETRLYFVQFSIPLRHGCTTAT
jgi:hypothetical protein